MGRDTTPAMVETMTITDVALQNIDSKTIYHLAFDRKGKPVLVAPFKKTIRNWRPENWRHYERLPLSLLAGAGGMLESGNLSK